MAVIFGKVPFRRCNEGNSQLPKIPLPRQRTTLTLAGLPEGIHLTHGNLSVDFTGAQDLVEKLFTVAQAFADDYESLEAALEPDGEES